MAALDLLQLSFVWADLLSAVDLPTPKRKDMVDVNETGRLALLLSRSRREMESDLSQNTVDLLDHRGIS